MKSIIQDFKETTIIISKEKATHLVTVFKYNPVKIFEYRCNTKQDAIFLRDLFSGRRVK